MPTTPNAIKSSVSKAIVVGGGIGGLTFARACLDVGIEVELYEKRHLDSMLSGPGGIFIQRNAMRVYKLLWDGKIYNRFYEQGGKILKGGFFSKDGTPLYINTPGFVGEDDLGVCLLRPELQQILYESLPAGTVRTGIAFEHFEDTGDGVRVFFNDGSIAEGDILVGADGLYSKVRARLNDREQLEQPIYSGMCCWRGYFNRSNLPLDDRYSWGEFWGQGNRFGYFDVGGGRFGFYAFKNTESGGNDDAVGGSLKVMRSLFSDYADPVPAIIESLDQYNIYRDDILDRQPLSREWGRGQVTLIGDAAHPVQPNLGQGGCMAVEDAFELVKGLLTNETNYDQVPTLLRQFENSRSNRVTRVFNISRQVGNLGQADTAFGCFLRNWIYKLTPTWLADWQFRWLFDYQPEWNSYLSRD
ncbi:MULTISPECIES: FAD-dependent monooxygenase [unclassified Coleofasciculus]|uniref:FAD-dependent monooxygenase n=1 Tax=unclassified Coleofasciculus TaxID=2692782 RepID=UPI0018812CDE|nr:MULTISPECIES: FAD-dependent monooxygenase [unclassified Coleofasciculus]MBE9127435.1 FAD-dependent monooxygenase [Coleofasciculus sp. LEGE 07081]MBE9149239.1 FAD-dependent monooxygenase [Coleofasciculus sp. LEGE 07092]